MSVTKKGEKENKATLRRTSMSDETLPKDPAPTLKEMMCNVLAEIQKIQEKQDAYQVKQEAYQKTQQEQMLDLKKELKEEIGKMRTEMMVMQQEINELQKEKKEVKETQAKVQAHIKKLELKNSRLEAKQEETEAKDMEFQLRLRNIQEEVKEDISAKVIEILTELMECPKQEMKERTDRIYRINTNYAKRNKTARDVIVHFTKKTARDDILRVNNRRNIYYKGKKIIILKEFPSTVLKKRRKYAFLTEELKNQKIRFRWERDEGLMLTYEDKRYWIKDEERAKEFLQKIKKNKKPKEREHEEGRTKKKKRTDSLEELAEKEELRKNSEDGRDTPNILDTEEEEIEGEEEEDGNTTEEEEERNQEEEDKC
nr:trichohyalin-like [Anolis sagrei ordinatus]